MRYKQNLHTHSSFGDGAETPEEIIERAIALGFDSIGFSEHSYFKHSTYFANRSDNTSEYRTEIHRLKEKYNDSFPVFCGLEVELYSDTELSGFDYLIGSVHYLKVGDEYVGFDVREPARVKEAIDRCFDGSGIEFAKAYYKTVAELPSRADFDIIGHFDLLTKHREIEALIDTSSKEYRWAAIEAAEALSGRIPYFEVNTGGVARGYRDFPYPSAELTRELKRLGFGAVISSDAHKTDTLDFGFEDAERLLLSCGFKERYILTDNGFVGVEIMEEI